MAGGLGNFVNKAKSSEEFAKAMGIGSTTASTGLGPVPGVDKDAAAKAAAASKAKADAEAKSQAEFAAKMNAEYESADRVNPLIAAAKAKEAAAKKGK